MVKVKKPFTQKHSQIKKVVTKSSISKKLNKKPSENVKPTKLKQSILEEKFNINVKDVENAVAGVIKLQLNNPKLKNQLFEEDTFPINLMINCHTIPTGHQKILRVPLKHSLLSSEDEVCLIVSEVKGIGNKEHEKHVNFYEELLAKKNVSNIKKIMTVHELNHEHETHEQKRRLVDLYDAFLVCAKVSGKVVNKCGKAFYKKRKVPTAVKLNTTKLKEHIDRKLSMSMLHINLKGNNFNCQLGHSKMNIARIVDNFVSTVEYLEREFPGGFENIKGLHIFAPRSTSIPVYVSAKNPKDLQKVKVQTNNKFLPKSVKDELTTLPNAQVLVKPSGQVIVTRTKDDDEEQDDDKITLKDIVDDIKNKKKLKTDTQQHESRMKLKSKKSSNEVGEENSLHKENGGLIKPSKKNIQSGGGSEQDESGVKLKSKKKPSKKTSEENIQYKENEGLIKKSKKKLQGGWDEEVVDQVNVSVEPLIKKKKENVKPTAKANFVTTNLKNKVNGKSKSHKNKLKKVKV